MNTKGLFDFYNVIYTYDKGDSVIKALCSGKMRFSRWVDSMFKKRKAFEACVFTCYLENDKFKEQLLIYENRFKQSLEGYVKSKWFDEEFDRKQNPCEFFTRKYHEVRKRQIELALEYIEKVKNPRTTNLSVQSETSVENVVPHFEGYSTEVITDVFEYLIDIKYLDAHTSKEDFLYYFTGEGEIPTNRLKWRANKVDTAIFVETLFGKSKKRWDITAYIFDELNNYANIYSRKFRTVFTDKEEKFQDALRSIIKSATR